MAQPPYPEAIFSSEILSQMRQLCTEFSGELQAGRKANIAALIRRIAPEARSALLTELYALRCQNLSEEEAGRIALQWKTAFPEFQGMKAPRVNFGNAAAAPKMVVAPPPGPPRSEPETAAGDASAPLPLELHRRIDQACVRFEADLRRGDQPDVTRLIAGFELAGRKELLEELLRLALDYRGAPAGKEAAPAAAAKPVGSIVELEQTLIGVLDQRRPPPADAETKSYQGPPDPDASTVVGRSDAPPAATSPLPRCADYEILAELGRGGMGVVYQARQISLQRLVALKMVLRAEFASQDELVRFRQEAESAAQLDHPGIVPVFEVGESDGRQFFSMAFVEGKTLSQRLQEGPLGLQEAAELVRQLAVAVAYAHSRGIVHRDLKPGNVLLDKTGRPRITDFGLAKRLDVGNELTMTGQIVGTPSYMPPEQARGEIAKIGPHSDVYSLGAVLYACLTGRPPFQAANPIETLQQVQHNEPARLRLLNKAIPRDLEIICLKCLAKRRSDRYESAAHLALDLGRWQRGEPIEARPIDRFRRALMWCQRHRSLTGAVVTAAVALLVLGIVQLRSSYVEAERQREMSQKQRDLEAERERVTSQRRLSQLAYADQQRAEGLALTLPGGDACQGMFRLERALRIAHDYEDAKRETQLRQDLVQASRNVEGRAFAATASLKADNPQALSSGYVLSSPNPDAPSVRQKAIHLQSGAETVKSWFPEQVFGPFAVSDNGELIAGFVRQPPDVWLVGREPALQRPPGMTESPDRLEFSSDGKLLAGSWKDRFWIWDIESRQWLGAPLVVSPQLDNPPKREIVGFQFDVERPAIRVLYAANNEFQTEAKGLWTAEFQLPSLAWTREIERVHRRSGQNKHRLVSAKRESRDNKTWLAFFEADTGQALGEPVLCPQELQSPSLDRWSFLATSDDQKVITFGDGWTGDGMHGWLFDLSSQKTVILPFLDRKSEIGGVTERVLRAFLSPDEQRFIGVGIGKVRIWDLETYDHREFSLQGRLEKGVRWEAAALTPKGDRLLLGFQSSEDGNGYVAVYALEQGKLLREIATGHRRSVSTLAISPEGATAYSGGDDNTLRVWNIETGEALDQPYQLAKRPGALALDAQGRKLAVVTDIGSSGELRLFETQPWKLAGYPIAWSNGGTPAFDDDGRLLPSFDPVALPPGRSGERYTTSSTVETVTMDEGKDYQPRQLLASASGIRSARLTSDTQSFAVLTADGKIEFRSTANGELLLAPFQAKSPIHHFVFASGDREIIAACADGTIERWLTFKSLPPPDDPAKTLDWIEWITGNTWDPAQSKSTPISDQRWQTLSEQFRQGLE